MQVSLPSIYDERPIDPGGVAARRGFSFQDEVAAGAVLRMLFDSDLVQVQCETEDDIVLVFERDGVRTLELVQSKAEALEQLYTVAGITRRENGPGTSLLERSLGRDRFRESATFRLVTLRQVAPPLTCMCAALESEERQQRTADLEALAVAVRTRLPDTRSDSGRDAGHWIQQTHWTELSRSEIHNRNLIALDAAFKNRAVMLLVDQLETQYRDLVRIVVAAAESVVFSQKCIAIRTVREWLERGIRDLGITVGTESRLRRKMLAASLTTEDFQTARGLRTEYLAATRSSGYDDANPLLALAPRLAVELMEARDVSTGQSGREFHRNCIELLRAISDAPPLPILMGAMYDITSRCMHKFNLSSK